MNFVIDRKIQPAILDIDKIDLIQPVEYSLDNNISVYLINAGVHDVVKIEFIFKAGSWYQDEAFVALSTNKMLTEGTENFSSNEISERIDYYGAYIEIVTKHDNSYVSLYTLNKHLDKTLEVLEEVIKRPVFPENELSIYLQKCKQEFIINNKKVDYLAKNKFTEIIFGKNHPYGINLTLDTFERINRNKLIDFYQKHFSSTNCKIIVSGNINESIINKLNSYFGEKPWNINEVTDSKIHKINSDTQKKHIIKKEDALQSAIRIGTPLFNKTHPNFMGLQVLNTVLGGYFGSRLMTNIREDKGYTYGIGSALVSFQNSGFFFITSEVGSDVCSKAVYEIYKEIERLKHDLIPEEELELVKNYMLGTFIRSIDGPFALAEKFKALLEYNLDYNYYSNFLKLIKKITPTKLKELAETYFDSNNFYELIVGKLK